jgi:hypothetical protein
MNYCKKHKRKYMTPFCAICIGEQILDHKYLNEKEISLKIKKICEKLKEVKNND